MTIGWPSIKSRKYGAGFYEDYLKEILARNFDLELIPIDSKVFRRGYLRGPEILFNLLKLKGKKDLWIRDIKTAITFPFDGTKGKNLVIIHHIDHSQSKFPFRFIDLLLEKIFYGNLKKSDWIVVVSEYWEKHFLDRGYENISVIHNPFDLSEFEITESEVDQFKKKYNLQSKPIIYLGNCQKAKGVVESYEVLKNLDAHLVTSGEKMVDLPVLNLNLDRREYLCLLKASYVVLAMSKMKEGWNRTAHEAMLLGTPVIGSGKGGMKELLEGGGQIICEDPGNLKEKVEDLLNDRQKRNLISAEGINFSKEFTLERFEREWISLINKIV